MVVISKGEIFHYLNIYPDGEFLYLELKALKDSETEHGLATMWEVLYSNSPEFEVGVNYSGNQFDGAALDGFEAHGFREKKDLLKSIFERKR